MDTGLVSEGSTGLLLSGTNITRVGDHNERVTLQAIRVSGPVTRIEVAAMTGLTAAAIAGITKRLLDDRLILVAGKVRGERGKPATKLAINPNGRFSLGLNVDRDHITLVVLDIAGNVRARASREVAFATPAQVRTFLQRSVGGLLAKTGLARPRLAGIGIAFPDDIAKAQLLGQPVNYSKWSSVSVAKLVREVLRIPVYVENDAQAAAQGEMQFGSGSQFRSFFYVLITAGLGGGLIVNGSYFRGANGRSGELGMLRARDALGNETQLQQIVSLSALYGRLSAAGFVVRSPRGLKKLPAAARAVADAWVEEAAEAMVSPIVAINCLINPEAILIGGRLPLKLVDQLAACLNERMARVAAIAPAVATIARAWASQDAPAIGAAILPFHHGLLPANSALSFKTGSQESTEERS